jgi:hypothetical protein
MANNCGLKITSPGSEKHWTGIGGRLKFLISWMSIFP